MAGYWRWKVFRIITVEQAFELTDASAERSAEAAVIALSKEQVAQIP